MSETRRVSTGPAAYDPHATLQQNYGLSVATQRSRWSETLQAAPVGFVLIITTCIASVFITYHLTPEVLRYANKSDPLYSNLWFYLVLAESLIFYIFLGLFLVSYFLAITTSTGSLPESDPYDESSANITAYERKKEGTRRYCKWCQKYKPDRAHHCRQCQQCVLKMDHHCPWLYNCVGWGNHKYFILSVFYAALLCVYVSSFQAPSIIAGWSSTEKNFGELFALMFGECVAVITGLITASFFVFHMILICHNMTTVEFVEKKKRFGKFNVYDVGTGANLNQVFGPSKLLWFLPIDNRDGDGINFRVDLEKAALINQPSSRNQKSA